MKYIKINLKPLSVNNAWQGKRFKTPEYNKFERDCLLMMPNMHIPSNGLAKWLNPKLNRITKL